MSTNPYERIYDELNIAISEETSFEEAQQIAKHLGYIYNMFGMIVKDFITMLGYKFKCQERQNSLNGNKKEKKSMVKDTRSEKKTKLDEKTAQQQLEGKNKTPPHSRLIKEIQNYRSSDLHDQGLQQQLLKSKLLQLRQERKITQEPSGQKVAILQQNQQQPQSQTKIPFRKKNIENVVINISSEDEQKVDDEKNGVKTRAQLRGVVPRTFQRPQKTIMRGRGKRGRPRKVRMVSRDQESSSESSEDKSKRGNSYPLDPNDPFTIIYNVPYNPRKSDSQSKESPMSKKEQKKEKRQQKRDSQLSSSLNSEEEEIQSQKAFESEKERNITPYHNQKFIDKVRASYMLEKQAIKDRLQNLHKEYEKNNVNSSQIIVENKPQINPDEQQEVEYDEMQQQEQSIQDKGQLREDEGQRYQQEQQYEIIEQQQQKVERNKIVESFEEGANMKDKEIHLQWLNNSIQKEFEENLRMNEDINEDEYEEEVYLITDQQNDDLSFRGKPQSENYAEESFGNEGDKLESNQNQQQQHLLQLSNPTDVNNYNPQQHQAQTQLLQKINHESNNNNSEQNNNQYDVEIDNIQLQKQNINQKNNHANHHNHNTDEVLRVLEEFESDDDQDEYASIGKDALMMGENFAGINTEYIPISCLISKKIGELDKNKQVHEQQKTTQVAQKSNIPILTPTRNIPPQQTSHIPHPQNPPIISTTILNQTSSIVLPTLTNQHKDHEQKKTNPHQYMVYTKKAKTIEIIELE